MGKDRVSVHPVSICVFYIRVNTVIYQEFNNYNVDIILGKKLFNNFLRNYFPIQLKVKFFCIILLIWQKKMLHIAA